MTTKIFGQDKQLAYVRDELGIPHDVSAINAGSWGPISRAARQAIDEAYDLDTSLRLSDTIVYMSRLYGEVITADRAVVATFLNCSPDEVALCESSTTAL